MVRRSIIPSAQCSVLSAQCSVLSAQCSVLSAQCSVLSAQCSGKLCSFVNRKSTFKYKVQQKWRVKLSAFAVPFFDIRNRGKPTESQHENDRLSQNTDNAVMK